MPAEDDLEGVPEAGGRAASEEGSRSGNHVQEAPEGEREGEGERPIQVLRVPEIATRDTEEKLGIQVKTENRKKRKFPKSSYSRRRPILESQHEH